MSSKEGQESKGPVIVEAATPPICSSCGRPIPPHEKGVKITCPNCGFEGP